LVTWWAAGWLPDMVESKGRIVAPWWFGDGCPGKLKSKEASTGKVALLKVELDILDSQYLILVVLI
jgi:hypothetical protein